MDEKIKNLIPCEKQKKHDPWLDIFRAIAAFLVVVCHYRSEHFESFSRLAENEKTIGTMIFFGFSRLGHEAVLIFFVLSGYLVGGNAIKDTLKGVFSAKKFFRARFCRVY